MGLGLNKARQESRGNRGGGQGGGQENVAILVSDIHVADANKKIANPDEDYAMGYLLHDAFGLKATFNADGQPETQVKFKMPKRNISGEHTPREIIDLLPNRRKGSSPTMGEWPTVVLERARMGRDGATIEGGWLTVAKYKAEDEIFEVLTTGVNEGDLTKTYPIYCSIAREADRNGFSRQQRFIVSAETAQTFSSVEEFRQKAAALLEEDARSAGFNNSVIVRVYDRRIGLPADQMNLAEGETADDVNNEFISGVVYRRWDKEAQAKVSAEAAVADFLSGSNEKAAQILAAVQAAGTDAAANYIFEVIQQKDINTGPLSLPSKKKGGRDDADDFRMPFNDPDKPGEFSTKNDGTLATGMGYAPAIFMVQRKNTEEDWFATSAYRINRRDPIFERYEIPSDNMPENVKKHFEALGLKRSMALIEEKRAAFASSNASESASDASDEIPFGEPDHGAGLTPSGR